MASARRSKATNTAPDGTVLNKDGTPRKRPGPAKGTPRGVKSTPKATAATAKAATKTATAPAEKPARKQPRKKKTFLIYAVDGNELSFATEHAGATGQIAVAAAVKEGVLAPNTPYVFLPPTTVSRQVEVEAVERDVQYKVKPVTKKRAPRKPKAETTGAQDSPAADPEAKPATSARASKAQPATEPVVEVAHPAPGETGENPFAT